MDVERVGASGGPSAGSPWLGVEAAPLRAPPADAGPSPRRPGAGRQARQRGGYGSELREFGYTGTIVSFEPMRAAATSDCATRASDDAGWPTASAPSATTTAPPRSTWPATATSSSLYCRMDPRGVAAAPWVGYVGHRDRRCRAASRRRGRLPPGRAPAPLPQAGHPGLERQVLDGGPDTLARCVGLQIELSFVPLYAGELLLVDEAISTAYADRLPPGRHGTGLRRPRRSGAAGRRCLHPQRPAPPKRDRMTVDLAAPGPLVCSPPLLSTENIASPTGFRGSRADRARPGAVGSRRRAHA